MDRGKIIVIVAPSGTGKSTLIEKLKDKNPELEWSVSCTTRPIRSGEVDGKDYFFISKDEFILKRDDDAFVEWAEVHSNYYGTLKSFVNEHLDSGRFLLFDLDVQGCDQIKKIYPVDSSVIFIEPPSIEILEKRLQNRGTDTQKVIDERIQNAKEELKRKYDFDYNVINDDIESAFLNLNTIVTSILGK